MAFIAPLRALRPTPASAPRVAAVPYDVVNAQEAHALANGNPLSFLHVSRAEIDLPPNTDPHSDTVYRKAGENFAALKTQAPLVDEEAPSLYVYRLQMGRHVQTGIAGTFSIDEYDRGVIKKHEHTRRDKENDRTRHMIELRAQTGPVFLTYRAASAVDRIVARVSGQQPLFDFTAPDGVQHTIWRADAGGTKDLVSYSPQSLLAKLREQCVVKEGPATPARKGEIAMFLDGQWHALVLGAGPGDVSPADRLDVSRLQDTVLTPLLGIGDVRTDKRIDFVGGARGTSALEKQVTSGKAAVAFSMFPVT